jgi:hypothetical protein
MSNSVLSAELMSRMQGLVPAMVDWMVQHVVRQAEMAYARTHPVMSTTSSATSLSPYQQGDDGDDEAMDGLAESHSTMQQSRSWPEASSEPGDEDRGSDDTTMENAYDVSYSRVMDTDDVIMADNEHEAVVDSQVYGPLVFSPEAASASRQSRRQPDPASSQPFARDDMNDSSTLDDPALTLGNVGAQGGGLYICLMADDIHSTQELVVALREFWGIDSAVGGAGFSTAVSTLYTDTILNRLVRTLRLFGHLVVSGFVVVVGARV